MGLRVLACGGRTFDEWRHVDHVLSLIEAHDGIDLIIDGGAPGADYLVAKWARCNRKPHMRFEAHWNTLGRKAGPIRNGWMLQFGKPDLVVAFPGGRGTENMIAQAKAAGVAVAISREMRSGEY